jgi:hypothetical protein
MQRVILGPWATATRPSRIEFKLHVLREKERADFLAVLRKMRERHNSEADQQEPLKTPLKRREG